MITIEILTDSFLLLGDSRTLLKQMPSACVDMVIADLPYADIENEMVSVFENLIRVQKKMNMYIFCSKKRLMEVIKYFVMDKGYEWELLTWHYTNPNPFCDNKYLNDTEFILFVREKETKLYGNYESKFTYTLTANNAADKRRYGHPTVKPFDLISTLIYNSTKPEEVVFDPFMGVGTSIVAAEYLGRKYIGFEINETYYNTVYERLGKEMMTDDQD